MAVSDYPVQETSINDLFAEDLDRIEVLGENARLVFWRWKKGGGSWQRIALEWAIVLPARTLQLAMHQWPNAPVTRTPEDITHIKLH